LAISTASIYLVGREQPEWWFQQTRDAQKASLMAEALDEQAKDDPDSIRGLM
jgi:hypothetical protein